MSLELGIYKGEVLDHVLATGHYRMGNELFTTNEVFVSYYGKSALYDPVFWLRLNLKKAKKTKTTRRIRKKAAGFVCTYETPVISDEIEELYSIYLNSVNFEGYPSCKACIPELNTPAAIFDTFMINIRDKGRLIGVGFVDYGKMDFVYPGYLTIGSTKMDYKIFPQKEAMEVYLPNDNRWDSLENHSKPDLEDYYFKQILGIDFDEEENASY
ncbi:MAG: hypothetical protein RI983_638 [Bacteroidota bacterium]|jgi:arginine-tRNA-protein transferase